jgi:hypothetical protein
LSVAAITWQLLNHCLATGVLAESLPSNSCPCWLHNSGFQQTCHNNFGLICNFAPKYLHNLFRISSNNFYIFLRNWIERYIQGRIEIYKNSSSEALK